MRSLMNDTRGIAIVGCGVVGTATAKHLIEHEQLIQSRYGVAAHLVTIVDLDLSRAQAAGLPESLLSTDLKDALSPDVDIVVELVGGTKVAYTIIEDALRAGKHVVTANKALLAHRGRELFAIAHQSGRSIAFEASCGGGIPLIRALIDGLAGSTIESMYGIVNGTCNFILSEMIGKELTYEEALSRAQQLGLAEADPTLDVNGHDSAHKIAIMASLAFGVQVGVDGFPVAGIDTLELQDVTWAHRLGYVPKLLAIAEKTDAGVTVRVRPSFIPESHPLAWVSGPFNAVSVYSYPTGNTMYYGRGAGGSATSGAIVADIVSILTGSYPGQFERSRFWPDLTDPVHLNGPGEIFGRYYVRAMVEDRPGTLAEMARLYGEFGISLASVHQDETADIEDNGEAIPVPVVVVTHHACEDDMMKAVDAINDLPKVHGRCAVVSIVDEPEEHLLGN